MRGVTLDADACFRALRARDTRFDGMFFVGVTSTHIYCRPICPARTPAPARCRFFTVAAEAERAGFRACLRCRPERAPGAAAVDAVPHLVRAATRRIDAGYLDDHSVEQLADRLGVTARHLRRSLETELGVSPVELAQSRRLALARQLLLDGGLPMTDVAHAAGFASLRRFNALFRARYGRPPSALRSTRARLVDAAELRLDYRPPLAWDALLGFLAARAVPGVEVVDAAGYRRTVAVGDHAGWIDVRKDGDRAVRVRVARALTGRLPAIAARVRALLDLDARPDLVDAHLAVDPALRAGVRARPGLRLPGAFDPGELAVRAVLGQQVSVAAATTLAARLAERFGRPIDAGDDAAPDGLVRLFPTPAVLAGVRADAIRAIGLPAARAAAIVELARALAGERIDLGPGADPARAAAQLAELPGIGPWTAAYVAMRALAWPDAFPAGDLVVRRALAAPTARAAERRAERWRPWRAYAVMHLWLNSAKETES
jgi:AraC family transcriptional regulator of adaptative response / DNA-3-methyladenine glycosylase II